MLITGFALPVGVARIVDIGPFVLCVLQAYATDSEARNAAEEASEGLRSARIAEMSTTGSMVTLSSLATMDEDYDTLQVNTDQVSG